MALGVTRGVAATGAADGTYAYVDSARGERFTVNLSAVEAPIKAEGFDPRTGKLLPAGRTPARGQYSFDPPGDPAESNDWVLVLSQG